MRLDFIFASPELLLGGDVDAEGTGGSQRKRDRLGQSQSRLVAAGIERSNITDKLSDHYPVFLSWADPRDPFADSNPEP
jgi:hypothetical protein